MAFMQLKSENPAFSFILKKNPASGMMIKEIRQGNSFGWYSNEQTFNIYFLDAENAISYKRHQNDNFEFINTTRYNSPMVILNQLKEWMNSTLKKKDEVDDADVFKSSLLINQMYVQNTKYLEIFSRYFTEYQIESTEVSLKNYRIKVSTKKSVRELLNYVALFSVFNVLKSDQDYLHVDEEIVKKYLECLQSIDAPYFVRYVFKVNLFRGENTFNKFKSILETSARYDIKLLPGNTAMQRRDAIRKRITFEHDIVDVGCGEGFYVFDLAKKMVNASSANYHAIDIDPEMRDRVSHKIEVKELTDRVKVYETVDHYFEQQEEAKPFVALLVEVIEHMPLEEAELLVTSLLENKELKEMLVTTPNKTFNQYYDFDDEEMRHDDHHFELEASEFTEWLTRIVPEGCIIEFFHIGDVVNNNCTSLGAHIRKAKSL